MAWGDNEQCTTIQKVQKKNTNSGKANTNLLRKLEVRSGAMEDLLTSEKSIDIIFNWVAG